MAAKGKKKQPPRTSGDQRGNRARQVIYIVISVMIILAMVLSFLIML